MFSANWIMYVEKRFDAVRKVRDEVMIGEMGMSQDDVYDARDYYAFHLLITDDETNEPIATARIRADKDYEVTYVGDIAVRKAYRTSNYAEFALRMLLYKAQKLSAKRIVAKIREDELSMYEKFGFKTDKQSGDKYEVSVARDEVLWPSECKGEH